MMADDRLPWFPCHPAKLLGALSALPPDQAYLYTIVLLRIYEVGGPIPDDDTVLARRSGFRSSHVSRAIARLCEIGKLQRLPDGRLMNDFAALVIAQSAEKKNTTVKNKKHAADVRWKKHKENQTPRRAVELHSDPHLHLHKDKEQIPLFDKNQTVAGDQKVDSPEKQYFDRGKQLLGQSSGALLNNLLKAKGNVALARADLETASTKQNPREWIGAVLRHAGTRANGGERPNTNGWDHGL